MKKFLSILIIALLFSCQNDNDFNKGKAQLENQGYIDVKSTGYKYFCCGDKDMYSTGFICQDKKGRVVKGCICSSPFKGVTIRFE